MRDPGPIDRAITDAQEVLRNHTAPGPRNAGIAMHRPIAMLDREDVVAALQRLRKGFGPRVVK
jgi:hypothetical protein